MCDTIAVIHALAPYGAGLFFLALLWIFRDLIEEIIRLLIQAIFG